MRVTFLNVGQADSTLITGKHGTVLIDGATKTAIARHMKRLRRDAPSLTRIVGTHYDQDHLSGLCDVVSGYGGAGIEAAILPPVLDPARRGKLENIRTLRGGADSPWLAEVLRALGLLEALRPLFDPDSGDANSEAIRRLHEVGFARLRAHIQSTRNAPDDGEPGEHVPSEWIEWLPRITGGELRLVDDNVLDASLIQLVTGELDDLIRELPAVGEVLSVMLQIAEIDGAASWLARTLFAHELGGAFHTVAVLAEAIIVATTLNKLVTVLDEEDIPWYTPIANASAQTDLELLPGFTSVHLAPNEAWIKEVWGKLPTLRKPGEVKGLPRVSISNELSHIVALFPWGRPNMEDWPFFPGPLRHGFLVTGDSDMRELSDDAEEYIGKCTLVDIPHHGGDWGSFPDVVTSAHSNSGPHIELYVSIDKKRPRGGPPAERQLDSLLSGLRRTRGARLWLSNLQPEATSEWNGRSPADGPDTTAFWRSPQGWVPNSKGGLCI